MADILTKALGTKKLRKFRSLFGVLEMDLSLRGSIEISSSTPDVYPGDYHLCHRLVLVYL